MYQYNKINNRKLKKLNFKKRKVLVLLFSVILLGLLAVDRTVAYLTANSGPLTNTFTPATISSNVIETFNSPYSVKQNVQIQNTGNTDAFIRATFVITWKDANNNIHKDTPTLGTHYSIDWGSSDWFLASDGYYYYRQAVAPNAYTSNLIDSLSRIATNDPPATGYKLNVEILGSAIQSQPNEAVQQAWPAVKVNSSGQLVINP